MKPLCILIICSFIGACLGSGAPAGGGSTGRHVEVKETEGTRLLTEGHSLSLTCKENITDTDTDTAWTKDGEAIQESERIKLFPNSTLYITSSVKDDIGEYKCQQGSDNKVFQVVQLTLHKHLQASTTVLENDKLALTCEVEGNPPPVVQWLKDGQLMENLINSTRLVFSENEYSVSNSSLLIKPIMKADTGSYVCLVEQFGLQLNTTTEVRVKDIYAALWPFLGIVLEVVILSIIILIYEKRYIKANSEDSDSDPAQDQKSVGDGDVRRRK